MHRERFTDPGRRRGRAMARPLGWSVAAIAAVLASTGASVLALPAVPVPPENPMTEPKRVLGKILFWDEQLSPSLNMSCGTCHQPGIGGSDPRLAVNPGPDNLVSTPDDRVTSFGVIRSDASNEYIIDPVFGLNRQATPRSANSTINAAYAPSLFWDGRATSQFIDPETGQIAIVSGGALESQAVGPIVSAVEMGHEGLNWTQVRERLMRSQPLALSSNIPADVQAVLNASPKPDYPELFRRAFGDTDITAKRIAFAIATYERTLIADQTLFDRYQAGTATLTQQQQQGFNVMPGANCTTCHFANNLVWTDHSFRNVGLRPDAEDRGRGAITGNPADDGKFKVPTLRNVALKKTFMHNGQFTTLAQVMNFYAQAPLVNPAPPNRDPLMRNTGLSAANQAAVVTFLTQALVDPRVANQTFPFDRPTLYIDRATLQPVLIPGGAVIGTGGVASRFIADSPALIGNLDYRLGLETPGALVGAQAMLIVASQAPVGGVLTPDKVLPPVIVKGSLSTAGTATVKMPIRPGTYADGQEIYVQWIIPDANAPGGETRSDILKVKFFCSSFGCPPSCPADFSHDGQIMVNDLFAYLDAWFAVESSADIDGMVGVGVSDLFYFLDLWFAGFGTSC